MSKLLLGFQLITAYMLHLLCCGLPLLIGIGGGLSVIVALKPYTPVLFCLQFVVFGFTFYRLYKPSDKISGQARRHRIIFWSISLLSAALFFYPPSHWFKSEEARLKQARMERFFKNKHR